MTHDGGLTTVAAVGSDSAGRSQRGERMTPRPKTAGVEGFAQTSVRFPRPLLKRARIRAATDEISFQALLISALDAELERREKVEARRARRSAKVATAKA